MEKIEYIVQDCPIMGKVVVTHWVEKKKKCYDKRNKAVF